MTSARPPGTCSRSSSDPVVGMEIAFLESQEGPLLRQEVSFNTDDIRFSIRHIVAAHAIDWRAFVKNPGAVSPAKFSRARVPRESAQGPLK